MSDTKSPTCILSTSCLRPSPAPNQLVTISSGVDSSRLARCGPALYSGCPHGGVGGSGALPGNENYSCRCCPAVNNIPVSPVHDNEGDCKRPPAPKSPRSSRTSGWKTSKFFSKSMTSGEILRGLKKLSLSSSSSNNSEDQPPPPQQQPSPAASLKSRLANFKKRSSYGNDETTVESESQPTPSKTADNNKNTQDEGIVCKKEDLKALICSATKRLPLCSPRKKRALRQTKSASFEPPTDDKSKKEPVRRAGSEESKSRRTNPPLDKEQTIKTEIVVTTTATKEIKEPVIVKVAEPIIVATAAAPAATTSSAEAAQPTCASKVKWDDSNVVDAVLIGDAIESFLKVSMSSDKDTKLFPKITFRKNSFEKKA